VAVFTHARIAVHEGRLDAAIAAAADLAIGRPSLEQSLAGWAKIDARFERACTLLLPDDRTDEGAAGLRALGCRPPATPGAGG
jgi:hypothetical protein